MKTDRRYFILVLCLILALSAYPLYMGARVVVDMVYRGTVMKQDYPKYIIPYTPVSLAVLAATLCMPLLRKYAGRYAMAGGCALGAGIFFVTELLLESQVTVSGTTGWADLESWQMFMCYIPPELFETRTWTPVDILLGEYHPAFKMHFYAISLVLILTAVNSIYGFAEIRHSGKKARVKPLALQTIAAVLFLGLCVLACFTAFYRTGELTVSPLSATLMCAFFLLFGVSAGLFAGSFLLDKGRKKAILLPAGIAAGAVLLMYAGEMILLSGHPYRFGSGAFFAGLGRLVLAPVDLVLTALAAAVTAALLALCGKRK